MMCRVLKVSRSGFYNWQTRPPSARLVRDWGLIYHVRRVHMISRQTYGAPRISRELRADGISVGQKRIARLMRQQGVEGTHRRRFRTTTIRDETQRPAPDLVERDFTATAPNQLWVADFTYVRTWAGWLYLAVVVDAFSRMVVGWSMRDNMEADLVVDALQMARWRRRPAGRVTHHSDQGAQYTSTAFGHAIRDAKIIDVSMGSVGDALRQRDGRVVLRDDQDRTARPALLADPPAGAHRDLRVHRGVVQPASAPLRPRLPKPRRLREDHPRGARTSGIVNLSTEAGQPHPTKGP